MAKSLKDQLANLNLRKAVLKDGTRLEVAMSAEIRRLYNCIQKYIDDWYESYTPQGYNRTFNYKRALVAEDITNIRAIGNTLRIGLGWNTQMALHPNLESVFHVDRYGDFYRIPIADRHNSYVPILMERGWSAPRLASMIGHQVENLTYFDGIHAVERGVADFNAHNRFGIIVDASDFYNMRAY